MSYTVAQRDLIQDPNVIVELDRIAAVTKRLQASIEALGGGQSTRDAEAGLDTGKQINTRPVADDGQVDKAIRWLIGPWLLGPDGNVLSDAVIRPPQITSTQDNYAPIGIDTAIGVELTSDAARIITGFRIAKRQRRLFFTLNGGSFNFTFPHENTGSIAAHRFSFSAAGESLILPPSYLAWWFYNVRADRWNLFSLPAVAPANLPTSLLAGKWASVGSWTYSVDVAQVDFTGLGSYNELAILLRNVTGSAANIRQLLVSTDGGSSFLNASGDYVAIDGSGIETNDTVCSFHNTSSALGRTMWGLLRMINLATPKLWHAGFPTTNLVAIIPTTTAINAIRVRPHTGNFTGGSIYVWGR